MDEVKYIQNENRKSPFYSQRVVSEATSGLTVAEHNKDSAVCADRSDDDDDCDDAYFC